MSNTRRSHPLFEVKKANLLAAIACALCCMDSGPVTAQIATATTETAPSFIPDVVYGHKDGMALTLDVFPPEGEANGAGILFMVSGGWVSRWAPPEAVKPLFAPYLKAGSKIFAVRHGSSPRYPIPDIVADVRRAVRFVRSNASKYEVDPDRLGVMGMSAGGHLSLVLGTTGDEGDPNARDPINRVSSRVGAVVAFVPPTDLTVCVWEAPETLPAYRNFPALDLSIEKAATYSPLKQVTSDDAPSLVMMGERDELVPPRHGTWIDEAFAEADVPHKLIIFPNAGHGLEGEDNRTRMWAESVGWFDKHLAKDES